MGEYFVGLMHVFYHKTTAIVKATASFLQIQVKDVVVHQRLRQCMYDCVLDTVLQIALENKIEIIKINS